MQCLIEREEDMEVRNVVGDVEEYGGKKVEARWKVCLKKKERKE